MGLQNTGVGIFSLLEGTFPTQGSNRGLLRCRQILYQLRYQGSQKAIIIRLEKTKTRTFNWAFSVNQSWSLYKVNSQNSFVSFLGKESCLLCCSPVIIQEIYFFFQGPFCQYSLSFWQYKFQRIFQANIGSLK